MRPNSRFELKEDSWLESFLKKKCYSLHFSEAGISIEEMHKKLHENCFIQAKIPVSNTQDISLLESLGFHLVDTNIVFSKKIEKSDDFSSKVKIRHAKLEDSHALGDLANDNFIFTRFHLDQNISKQCANDIKREWVKNFFTGKRGQALLVAESADHSIAGFNQLIFNKDELTIDLIAVDKKFQGQGMGKELIQAAQNLYPQFKKFIVGTQIANLSSIGLYQRMGFKLEQAKYVLHYHGKNK